MGEAFFGNTRHSNQEVHEPLAVDVAGHLLQYADAAVVVFDEVVVCGEDGGDFALRGEGRNFEFDPTDHIRIQGSH